MQNEIEKLEHQQEQFRAQNERLKTNSRNLRINNRRLEKFQSGISSDMDSKLKGHSDRLKAKNQQLVLKEQQVQEELDSADLEFDSETRSIISNHYMKQTYRETIEKILKRVSREGGSLAMRAFEIFDEVDEYEATVNNPLPDIILDDLLTLEPISVFSETDKDNDNDDSVSSDPSDSSSSSSSSSDSSSSSSCDSSSSSSSDDSSSSRSEESRGRDPPKKTQRKRVQIASNVVSPTQAERPTMGNRSKSARGAMTGDGLFTSPRRKAMKRTGSADALMAKEQEQEIFSQVHPPTLDDDDDDRTVYSISADDVSVSSLETAASSYSSSLSGGDGNDSDAALMDEAMIRWSQRLL